MHRSAIGRRTSLLSWWCSLLLRSWLISSIIRPVPIPVVLLLAIMLLPVLILVLLLRRRRRRPTSCLLIATTVTLVNAALIVLVVATVLQRFLWVAGLIVLRLALVEGCACVVAILVIAMRYRRWRRLWASLVGSARRLIGRVLVVGHVVLACSAPSRWVLCHVRSADWWTAMCGEGFAAETSGCLRTD